MMYTVKINSRSNTTYEERLCISENKKKEFLLCMNTCTRQSKQKKCTTEASDPAAMWNFVKHDVENFFPHFRFSLPHKKSTMNAEARRWNEWRKSCRVKASLNIIKHVLMIVFFLLLRTFLSFSFHPHAKNFRVLKNSIAMLMARSW